MVYLWNCSLATKPPSQAGIHIVIANLGIVIVYEELPGLHLKDAAGTKSDGNSRCSIMVLLCLLLCP